MFNGNIVKNSAEATQSTHALITDYGITLDETSCLCLVPPESILGTTHLDEPYFAWYANIFGIGYIWAGIWLYLK